MGFKSNRKQIDGNVRKAFSRTMEDLVGLADELAPVRDHILGASILWSYTQQSAEHLKARFGSALRYAAIRELGGVIRPVRAKRLVWRGLDGRWHSAMQVIQVPGGRKGSSKYGKPYLRPAGEKFGSFMDKHLRVLS